MKKGTVFRFTAGEYSSYHVMEWVKALKNFGRKDVLEKFLKLHSEDRKEYSANFNTFVTWMVAEGYVEIITDPGKEWHLGEYGTYDLSCPS